MAPSDFHLFGPMKEHLRGQKFAHDDEVMEAVQSWPRQKAFFQRASASLWTGGPSVLRSRGTMSKNKTQTISVSTLVKMLLRVKISCYLMTYPHTIYLFDKKIYNTYQFESHIRSVGVTFKLIKGFGVFLYEISNRSHFSIFHKNSVTKLPVTWPINSQKANFFEHCNQVLHLRIPKPFSFLI